MKLAVLAVAALLLIAGAAQAQTGSAPAKLVLARELIDASGGRAAFERQMLGGMTAMETTMDASLPSTMQRFRSVMHAAMVDEAKAIVPDAVEISARAYADNLSEQELRYLIDVQKNPLAQSAQAKLPAVLKEVAVEMGPLMTARMPQIMQTVVRKVCEEEHCTADQQRQIAEAATKAMTTAKS